MADPAPHRSIYGTELDHSDAGRAAVARYIDQYPALQRAEQVQAAAVIVLIVIGVILVIAVWRWRIAAHRKA